MSDIFTPSDMQSIAEEAQKIGLEELGHGIQDELRPSLIDVKNAAQHYLFTIEQLSKDLQYFTSVLKKQKEIRHSLGKNANYNNVEAYVKNREYISQFLSGDIPRKLYEETFNFQIILNTFLGQEVETIIVVDGDNGPELYRVLSTDILKFDYTSSGRLVARYNTTAKSLAENCQKLQVDNDKLRFSYDGLKATYAEVVTRYNIGRSRHTRMVMWIPDGVWKKMRISSLGDINEAYAGFIFLNRVNPSFMRDMEWNIDDFLLKGVQLVDNISGLLQGDISIGNLELAIKSAGASTLGLPQVESVARQIISENFDETGVQKIKEQLAAKGRLRNKLVNGYTTKANEIAIKQETIVRTNLTF